MTIDPNALLMGSGAPTVKFPTVGTTVTGTVAREPEARQQRDFRTQVPETWKDGSPKMMIVVQLRTNERDPNKFDDDGTRTLFIQGKHLTEAIRNAVRAVGANGIHTGGVLTVTYSGDGVAENGLNAPKLYTAQYQAPAAAQAQQQLMGVPAAATQQQYVPPVAQPAPAAESAPAGVDPATWARMTPDQQQRVIAAMGQAAGSPQQHFGY